AAHDYSVCGFGLAVGLGMLDGCEALLGIDRDEKLAESFVHKRCPVVCDHDLWDPKPSNEIIDSHYEIFVLREPGDERSEDVHAPPGKGPRRG
ncbi:hypothetical protein A2U01_0053651, partial [Trifolium medium]|nr:hypothetical protein [Trifolium medium]